MQQLIRSQEDESEWEIVWQDRLAMPQLWGLFTFFGGGGGGGKGGTCCPRLLLSSWTKMAKIATDIAVDVL